MNLSSTYCRFLTIISVCILSFTHDSFSQTYPTGYNTFVNLFNARKTIMGQYWSGTTPNWAYGEREQWRGWRKAAEHFGDPGNVLEGYAQKSGDAWRDDYLLPNNGGLPGYYIYTDGFTQDWLLNGDTNSRNAVILQSINGSYAADYTPLSWTSGEGASREVAYNALGYINAEVHIGQPHRKRLMAFVDLILGDVNDSVHYIYGSSQVNGVRLNNGGHFEQWLGTYTTDTNGNYVSGTHNFAATDYGPFMAGYSAWTMIKFNKEAAAGNINGGAVSPDPRFLPKLIRIADATWNEYWVPADSSLRYRWTSVGGAPDVANDVFPFYAWLYTQTCEERFRARAEMIFNGSKNSYGANGGSNPAVGFKQWNDYIRHTFDGLEWYADGIASCYAISATFSPSISTACTGACITYTNQSLGTQTQWNWSFPGGNPSSSTLQNPGTVCYSAVGSYTTSLIVSNTYIRDTVSIPVTINSCTGIEKNNLQDVVSVYPNPGNGNFIIEGASHSSITITNAVGEEVKSLNVQNERAEVDLGNIASGVYYLKISTADQSAVKKIIVN